MVEACSAFDRYNSHIFQMVCGLPQPLPAIRQTRSIMPPSPSSQPASSFPDSDLPKWLLAQTRMALVKFRDGFRRAARDPKYDSLSRFAHDLGMCLRTASELTRGLEICIKSLQGTRLGDAWSNSVTAIRGGATLEESLRPGEEYLPAFFLPVVKAGEQAGRLDEAFSFLESHCRLLAGPASAVRNLWFMPLIVLLFGSAMKVVLAAALASIPGAIAILFEEAFGYLKLFAFVGLIMLTPARYFVDQVRLGIPWIGPLEREIAMNRFFRVLALVYAVGGQRVEEMIRLAASTVTNQAARIELLKSATAIENGCTIPEAFAGLSVLTRDEKTTIEGGEMSGTLEQAFDRISDDTGNSMISKLKLIQPFLMRIVMSIVTLSIVFTLLGLLSG